MERDGRGVSGLIRIDATLGRNSTEASRFSGWVSAKNLPSPFLPFALPGICGVLFGVDISAGFVVLQRILVQHQRWLSDGVEPVVGSARFVGFAPIALVHADPEIS
jgi:hypothetical protein